MFVKLMPKDERTRTQDDVVADIRRELGEPRRASTASIATGFSDRARSRSSCSCRARRAASWPGSPTQIAAEVRQVPGAVDVGLSTKGQKPELDVQIDRGLAGSLGVTVGQVAQALRPAFAGIDVGDWIDPSGETRDVTVRLAPESRTVVADLESLPLVVNGPQTGRRTIPLGQVARDHAVDRSGAHRSPRSRARHHRRGEHRGAPAVGRRAATSWRASRRT